MNFFFYQNTLNSAQHGLAGLAHRMTTDLTFSMSEVPAEEKLKIQELIAKSNKIAELLREMEGDVRNLSQREHQRKLEEGFGKQDWRATGKQDWSIKP